MLRTLLLALVAACSSSAPAPQPGSPPASPPPPTTTTTPGATQTPAPAPLGPAIAWQPLVIDGAPITALHELFVQTELAADALESIPMFIRGRADTAAGTYDLLWTRDELNAFPSEGMRSLPRGMRQATVVAIGGKHVVRVKDGDRWRDIATSKSPVAIVAQVGESTRYELVVFGDLATGKLQLARRDEGKPWKTSTLPTTGPVHASLVNGGMELALAWTTPKGPRTILLRDEHGVGALPRPAPVPLAAIATSCASDALWLASDSAIVRLHYGSPLELPGKPDILACSSGHVLLRFADGTGQRCSFFRCEPVTLPTAPTVGFVGDALVSVAPTPRGLAIVTDGTRRELATDRTGGDLRVFDFGGTLVLIALGDDPRWAVIR